MTPPGSSFAFNGTLTSFFTHVAGGQQLSAVRLDFSNAFAPPKSDLLKDGSVFINNGIQVAFGTPLQVQSVPIPDMFWPAAALLLVGCLVARRRMA